jgi:hypothetical protein
MLALIEKSRFIGVLFALLSLPEPERDPSNALASEEVSKIHLGRCSPVGSGLIRKAIYWGRCCRFRAYAGIDAPMIA